MTENKAVEALAKAKEMNNIINTEGEQPSVVQSLDKIDKAKLDLITKDIALPSKGLPYEGAVPDGKLTIRMMKVSDNKLLFSTAVPQNQRLNQIISRIVLDLPIPVTDLLIIDKFYIIVQSRILSLGADYTYKTTCDNCGRELTNTIDLSGLTSTCMSSDQLTRKLKLPISGRELTLKQMTVGDEASSTNYLQSEKLKANKQGKKVGEEVLISYTLAMQIESVEGLEDDLHSKLEFIDNMCQRDYESIQQQLKKMEFGLDVNLMHTCPSCESEMFYSMPFSVEFFRPAIY